MQKVKSVLASGNIIFEASGPREEVTRGLESTLSEKFGEPFHLFLHSMEEIQAMQAANPFSPEPEKHIYILIGDDTAKEALPQRFAACPVGSSGTLLENKGYLYWEIAKGNTLDVPFSKVLGDRKLQPHFTSRNINTLEKVLSAARKGGLPGA